MKRLFAALLAICLLLSGCANVFDGSYVSTKPHLEQSGQTEAQTVSVSNYEELCAALGDMAEAGRESQVISVANYDQSKVQIQMYQAARDTVSRNPIAAYAVEDIHLEMGTSGGQPAIAVSITYLHDRAEIRKIREVADLEAAKAAIAAALDTCAAGIVLYLEKYEEADFAQIVEDYADANPKTVMETPTVTANVYPETGGARVLELKFAYQNSRDVLRSMQSQVSPVFASAVLYVSGDGAQREKFSQLYSFLMRRYEYLIETSITPAYSLLRHGVGDEKAFAVVYAAMCREAGLDCQTVTGTRWGEPWVWNIICDDGVYYHIDLLLCSQEGEFRERSDADMVGYVWDYSAYPYPEAEETQPQE